LEADEAVHAVHLLEAGGHEADDGCGNLGGCEVLAYSFADSTWRVEQG
jgi:hypothetical protein